MSTEVDRSIVDNPPCPNCDAIMVRRSYGAAWWVWDCPSCGSSTEASGVVEHVTRTPAPCVATVYLCKVCGVQKRDANHWYLLECLAEGERHIVGVSDWNETDAACLPERTSLVPVCGEAHAQVLLSRWFETKSFEPSRQFIPEGPGK